MGSHFTEIESKEHIVCEQEEEKRKFGASLKKKKKIKAEVVSSD